MRVPTLDGPQVQTRPQATPYSNLDVRSGLGELGQSVQQLGGAIDKQRAIHEEVQRRARAIDNDGKLAALQRGITDDLEGTPPSEPGGAYTPGFYATEGKAAHEKSTEVLEGFEKRYMDIASTIGDPFQKQEFSVKARNILNSARGGIERHTLQQFKVEETKQAAANEYESLRAEALNPYDVELAHRNEAAAMERARRMHGESDDSAKAYLNQWREKSLTIRMESLLGSKKAGGKDDWQTAEAILESSNGGLGIHEAGFRARIAERKQLGGDAATVLEIVGKNTDKLNGWTDANAARADFAALPPEDQRRIGPLLDHHLAISEQKKKKDIESWETKANALYFEGGMTAVRADTGLFQKLKEHDADFLIKMRREQEMDTNRRVADKRASAQEKRQAEQAQKLTDELAMLEFRNKPEKERLEMNVATELLGSGVSERGRLLIGAEQMKQKEMNAKGHLISRDAFVENIMAAGQGVARSKEAKATLKAEAEVRWREEYEANDQKPPTADALKKAKDDLLLDQDSGKWWKADRPGFRNSAEARKAALKAGQPQATGEAPKPTAKPTAAARAKALKASGMSLSDIAKTLTSEGY